MRKHLALTFLVAALAAACTDHPSSPELADGPELAAARGGTPGPSALQGPFSLTPPVFDIESVADGSLLYGVGNTVMEIRKGETGTVQTVPTVPGSALNGFAAQGRGNFFATSAGLDLAVGAGLWHVSHGHARLVGDIEAFETARDPDASVGPAWKDPACEATGPFSAGPQSNPYHVATLSGNTALVADAAGNSLLRVEKDGDVEVVAVFTPPVAGGGASTSPADWMPLPVPGVAVPCYVQPVPTSVAVGPDGAYYVGELIGLTPANFGGVASPGLSRVWRIEAGSEGVSCPSPACTLAFTGFTSVIDVAFGPDGTLYVLEYDENGWALATDGLGTGTFDAAGGTLNACTLGGGCTPVAGATGLVLPGAVTFDKWGDLWLLENNIGIPAFVLGLAGPDGPTVDRVALP